MECIPNFSEGRRLEVVGMILRAIRAVQGVKLLHHTSDADHNRTVVTFAGEPGPVMEAAFVAIKTAAEHIDMDQHQGVHPRLGATDVVPFVPLQEMTLDDCAVLARKLGQRVGHEFEPSSLPI